MARFKHEAGRLCRSPLAAPHRFIPPFGQPTVADQTETKIPRVVEQYESEILADWTRELVRGAGKGAGAISENELRAQAGEFLNLFRRALRRGTSDLDSAEWNA